MPPRGSPTGSPASSLLTDESDQMSITVVKCALPPYCHQRCNSKICTSCLSQVPHLLRAGLPACLSHRAFPHLRSPSLPLAYLNYVACDWDNYLGGEGVDIAERHNLQDILKPKRLIKLPLVHKGSPFRSQCPLSSTIQ